VLGWLQSDAFSTVMMSASLREVFEKFLIENPPSGVALGKIA